MTGAGRWACWTALLLVGAAAGAGGTLLWLKHESRPDETQPPQRWEATIYLPTADNPTSSFQPKDWDDAVGLLVDEFGGASLGTEVEGLWRGADGKLVREKVRPVVVSFETHRLADFRRVVDRIGQRLRQEAVYARFEKPRVELRRIGTAP